MQPPLWWLFLLFFNIMRYICFALHLVLALHIVKVFFAILS